MVSNAADKSNWSKTVHRLITADVIQEMIVSKVYACFTKCNQDPAIPLLTITVLHKISYNGHGLNTARLNKLF